MTGPWALPEEPREPITIAADAAVRAVRAVISTMTEIAPACVDEVRDSAAVIACVTWNASFKRGAIRRELCEIARGKCARIMATFDLAERCGVPCGEAMATARVALDEAMDVLAPPRRALWSR